MLFATTRNNQETYTVYRAIADNRAPDGGLFVPLQFPKFTSRQIQELRTKPFNPCLADILNQLVGTKFSAYDLDFTVGRSTARLVSLPHRIWVGESWHNLERDFRYMEKVLYQKVADNQNDAPSDWFRIALRIGVMRKGAVSIQEPLDIAVESGDFSGPAAALYARQMGLPIGNIIICCNDNNNPWELLHHGQIRTNTVAVSTSTPDGDYVIAPDLERFIHICGGSREVGRFILAVREGRMFVPGDTVLESMRKGTYASVVGADRVGSAIPNVYRTHGQYIGPYTALAYSGLLDYRVGAGEHRHALVLSEKSPDSDLSFFAEAMGLTHGEAIKRLQDL